MQAHLDKGFIENFGKQVRHYRTLKGFSMEFLANLCDIEYSQISRIENGTKTHNTKKETVLNTIVQKIQNAPDGCKHNELLKASRLAGGYIASGVIDYYEAVNLLENTIKQKDIKSFTNAQKTIVNGIEYGKQAPIYVNEEPSKNTVNKLDQDYIPTTL